MLLYTINMNRLIFVSILVVSILASCNKKPDRSVTPEATNEQTLAANRAASDKVAPIPQDLIPVTGPTVVDFYATWCRPCKELAPVLERLEKKYEGRITFMRIDVDENPELAQAFQVESIPTLFFITTAGVVDASIGLVSEAELDAQITAMLARNP